MDATKDRDFGNMTAPSVERHLVMRLPVCAIISILLLCCAYFCPPACSQTGPAKIDSHATVSGKITLKGKPAPGVVVGLRSNQPAQFDPTFKATTDQDGKYRITDVPEGTYLIAPVAPAFVISDVNHSRGKTVLINEGDNIEGIDFDLMRGGVITGKITDAEDHPIVEERVSLLPVEQNNQRPTASGFLLSFQTDDRGIYRIFGLPPGRYRVSVGEGSSNRRFGRGPVHLTTFYPGTTDQTKAAVIEIDEGTEATKIDIVVGQRVQGVLVSGRILDGETGKPVPNVSLGLSRIVMTDTSGSSHSEGGIVRSDGRGEFRLEKVSPAKYSLSIEPASGSDLRAEPITFDVFDQDVTGLTIKTSIGASLSGTVVFDGTVGKNATAAMERAYISALIRSDDLKTSWSRAEWIPRDGSFRLGGLPPGVANFSLGTMSNAQGLAISRVERDGVTQPNGVQIQNAEQISGIRVVVTYVNGSIRGVVRLENGTLPPSGRLFIQLTKPGDPNVRTQPRVVDSRGHFLIDGLAVGTYELTVTAYAPEWRQRPVISKQLVTVTNEGATDVVVTMDLATIPKP